jgi:hypothetical protein
MALIIGLDAQHDSKEIPVTGEGERGKKQKLL